MGAHDEQAEPQQPCRPDVDAAAHHIVLPADRPDDRTDAAAAAWSEPGHRAAALRSLSGVGPSGLLLVDVWVFSPGFEQVLLVQHRRRGWVMPGGKVEPGESARTAARRELHEETGLHLGPTGLDAQPAEVRWTHQRDVTLCYVTVVPTDVDVVEENGQAVAWHRLNDGWDSVYPHDVHRLRREADRRRNDV